MVVTHPVSIAQYRFFHNIGLWSWFHANTTLTPICFSKYMNWTDLFQRISQVYSGRRRAYLTLHYENDGYLTQIECFNFDDYRNSYLLNASLKNFTVQGLLKLLHFNLENWFTKIPDLTETLMEKYRFSETHVWFPI